MEGLPARVELRLDGTLMATIEGGPWRAPVDFGADPIPRELVATAFGADGKELARERQFVNLARPPAEAELVVERDLGGRPRAVRVAWGNLTGKVRPEIELRLDGQALAVDAAGRAALGPLDPERAHLLSAELRFSPVVVARRDLVLGGEWSDRVATEWTALPLAGASGRPSTAAVAAALTLRDSSLPAQVASIEEGPAQVLFVRNPSSAFAARRLRGVARRPDKFVASFGGNTSGNRFDAGDASFARVDVPLGREDRVRVLWPVGIRSPGASLPTRLFDATPELRPRDGGVLWLLTRISHPEAESALGPSRLADATAVAGLPAMAAGRRRAVVLVLSDEVNDPSFYTPAQARAYLSALRVPLFVWSLQPLDDRSSTNQSLVAQWGAVEDVSTVAKLRRAVLRLRTALEEQRIVWVEGLHRPMDVGLTADARRRGWRWAGEVETARPLP